MVYPDNIDRRHFNSQLGTRSDRRHCHLAHLQISPLSEPRSKSEYLPFPARATHCGRPRHRALHWGHAARALVPGH
jgi:hypothetical protein